MKQVNLKLFTLLSLFFFFCALDVSAQENRITVNVRNGSLKDVFNAIEKQTSYRFSYRDVMIDSSKDITISETDVTVPFILSKVFAGKDLKYTIVSSKSIVISDKVAKSSDEGKNTRKISGNVKDEKGEPVIGANVQVEGQSMGVITDINGQFALNAQADAVLLISYIGYIPQKMKIASRKDFSIILKEDSKMLDEVVVVGYGTQRKEELTSSVTSVKSKDFIQVSTPDAASLIRGKVAGLAVIQPDANPLSVSQIMLRGTTTLKSGTSPLILIDGIPGDLNSVSPNDIEQIDVLKDGSAAAIYGTRGTNGVILVSTKKANKEIEPNISINSYISTQQITKKLGMMTASQYREMAAQGVQGAIDKGGSTNWLNEILQTPFNQTYSLNLRGGSNKTSYIASFDYTANEGIVKKSNMEVIYPRINVTHRMFDSKLKIEANLSGYQRMYDVGYNTGEGRNPYDCALLYNPTYTVKHEDGTWNEDGSSPLLHNPVALLEETKGKNKTTNLLMYSKVTLSPIEGLDVSYLISSESLTYFGGYYETKKHESTTLDGKNGYASRTTSSNHNNMMEFTLQYNKQFNNTHNLNALAGYSWNKWNYQYAFLDNYNFPSDDYSYNNMGAGSALKEGRANEASTQNESKLIGYFGRINYNYSGKYFFSASIRREGSSKFGADHKWGTFPAVSIGWNMKGENFLINSKSVSTFKLRAGYGVTGTVPNDPYMSLNRLNLSGYGYLNGEWINMLRPNGNSNPDLRWEKKKELNVGIDFGFLNDRISGSIDYYNRKTDDLIWDYAVPVPPYVSNTITANAGSIKNEGLEIAFSLIPVTGKNFVWNSDINFSTNKSKLVSLSNDKFIAGSYTDAGWIVAPIQQSTHRLEEGQPLGNFYGYKSIDIDNDGHWIIEGADGNSKSITEQQATDKKVIGNGLPKWYLNFNNTLTYKRFDLNVSMRGAFGFQILNTPEMFFAAPVALGNGNVMNKAFDNVYGKRPLADDQELQYVSYYVQNGDYWKIDNLTLGYTPDVKAFKFIKKLRIYASVSNLATITGYSGIDPEVGISGLTPGIDDKRRYPAARTYTFGANVSF